MHTGAPMDDKFALSQQLDGKIGGLALVFETKVFALLTGPMQFLQRVSDKNISITCFYHPKVSSTTSMPSTSQVRPESAVSGYLHTIGKSLFNEEPIYFSQLQLSTLNSYIQSKLCIKRVDQQHIYSSQLIFTD